LRAYLQREAHAFDVIEFDHEYLPFPRGDFDPAPLMVARSVLLVQHLQTIAIPRPNTLRSRLGRLRHGPRRAALQRLRIEQADRTIRSADVVNVSNDRDRAELVRRGVEPEKIVVLPFGMSARRREMFRRQCSDAPPAQPVVGFVGTFDYRKGALDLPSIVASVCTACPDARFRLLGTDGMIRGGPPVLRFFPRAVRHRIEVVPGFEPDALPRLLAAVSVGVFPSYLEGFGLGVLEMLAAAVPVIAYDAPGPPFMLPPQHLVGPGDVGALSARVLELLRDPARLASARLEARQLAQRFDWSAIARQTIDLYEIAISKRRRRQHPARAVR
jgi:glycosyltransferase involved in cell wall biosynthesis